MKKLFLSFSAAVLVFAACQEEIAPVTDSSQAEVKEYPVEMTFTATSELGTKTTLNGTSVTWNDGDKIKVLWAEGSNAAETAQGGATATFSTRVDEGVTEFWAAYPYAESTVLSDEKLVVEIPSEQGGSFADANYAVAKTSEATFEFKHLVGLVEVQTSLANASRITIKGAEGDVLAGTVTVSGFSTETGLPEYVVTGGETEVVLKVDGAGIYYAALLPTAALQCLSVCVETTDGETATTEYALSANALNMERAKIVSLGNIDSRLGKNFFVTPEGTEVGDGKTWETAMSYQQMAQLLCPAGADGYITAGTAADDLAERAEKVHGATFRLAEGDYDSKAYIRITYASLGQTVRFNVLGGYDKDSKATDLSKRNVMENITRIVKPTIPEDYGGSTTNRHLYILDYVDAEFDGITFYNGVGDDTAGGGSLLYRPSDFNSEVRFTNCIFDGNTAGCGGAISQRNGHLVLENCRFVGNSTTTETVTDNATSQGGGCIYVGGESNATASEAKLTISNCVFGGENETDANTSGYTGSAVTFRGAELSVSNTSFTKNKANYSGTLALYKGAVSVSGCTFTGNTLDHHYGAGIFTYAETLTVSDTDFTGNVAKEFGGAIASYAGTTDIKEGCTFTNNCATERDGNVYGGAVYVSGSSTVNIDGATFVDNYVVNNSESESPKAFGGAITVNSGSTLTLSNSTISRSAENTTVSSPDGGGAVSVHASSSATLENVTISNCTTSGDGGAFFVDVSELVIKGTSSIKGCSAAVDGGVGYIKGATAVCLMNGGEISENTAVNGGVVRLSAGAFSFSSVAFKANVATAGGGVVYNDNGRFLADKCHFDGNNSATQGGVVRNGTTSNNPESFFNSCSFTRNYTSGGTQHGDVFYAKGGTIGVNNCALYANGGKNQSGDIVLASDNSKSQVPALVVVNSTFYKNPEGYAFDGSTKYGIMYSYANDSYVYYLNNVLLKPDSSALKVGSSSSKSVEVSGGFNYRGTLHVTSGCTYTPLGNEIEVTWDAVKDNFSLVNNGYQWTGLSEAESTDYTMAKLTDITGVLNNDTRASSFYTWLKSLSTTDPLTVDFYGNSRDTDAMWPGCYQGK